MSKDKTWGDGFIIQSATLLYQRPAVVLLSGQESPIQVSDNLSASTSPIHLGYVAVMSAERNHYVSLKPEGQPPCQYPCQTETGLSIDAGSDTSHPHRRAMSDDRDTWPDGDKMKGQLLYAY